MKIIKLWGGLGNQLFQYAFGQSLISSKNENVFYFFEDKARLNDQHSIKYFDKDIPLVDIQKLNNYNYITDNQLLFRIRRKLIQKVPKFNTKVFVEKELGYMGYLPKEAELFDGYWQSYKYLEPIENYIREKIKFDENEFSVNPYIPDIIQSCSISLHIRRGDYLSAENAKIFEVCTLDYYQKAIHKILQLVENPVFYVFSNDIVWVKDNLVFPKNIKIKYVDNSEMKNSVIFDLYLMSICKHHIIANSTFSWWGAWLNPSKEKIVIAPEKWYVGKLNNTTIDLIPSTWIRL